VARDATARLYDVDQDSFQFQKMNLSEKYDIGVITFRAKKGKLIDLRKLHESVWASRLSGGTRSGVICLEVTAVGKVELREDDAILDVRDGDRSFILVNDVNAKPEDAKASEFAALRQAVERGQQIESVTGYVEGWIGRWPSVLSKPPAERPRLMVTGFKAAGENSE